MSISATGQITIIDYNDALSLNAFITSNQTKTQIYNPDNKSYLPDWKTTNIILSPSLFVTGVSTDIITTNEVKSVDWYYINNGTKTKIENNIDYSINTTNKSLTIKKNIDENLVGIDYIASITFYDSYSELDIIIEAGITLSKVLSGSDTVNAIAWLPDGNIFKNDEVISLTAQCDLWKGSIISDMASYQWYKKNPTQSTDQGGGVGWQKLSNDTNIQTGVTTNIITVFASSVAHHAVYKCIVTDSDPTSSTFDKKFEDTVTFTDQSDPIHCVITSSEGNIFKNGAGESTLIAKIYQAGQEIDINGDIYLYKWYKYNKLGTLITNWGGTNINYKLGKQIVVKSSEIDEKATFIIEIER